MAEINEYSNKKTIINLSRNAPVALVVGAAGFLGSHLSEKLLEKGIQVVGLDNLSEGQKDYLNNASKNKDFHIVIGDAQDLDLDFPRLDYLFLLAGQDWDIGKALQIFKKTKCRCVFISWINLYEKEKDQEFAWFKENEVKLAKFAQENHLNARILRFGPVFGPRMNFDIDDPIVELIRGALTEELQEDVSLAFSTRALYIDDAVELIIKSMLAGGSAQKIFDGVLPTPIRVSDIKQVLLDPVWFENKGFYPAELPPWPTPNLEKTQKFLNWRPKIGLVASLKQTLNYFKDNEIKIPKSEDRKQNVDMGEEKEWDMEKKEQLEAFKSKSEDKLDQAKKKNRIKLPKFNFPFKIIYLFFVTTVIVYGLIWPIFALGLGFLTFRYSLGQAAEHLTKGEFEDSLKSVQLAKSGANETRILLDSFEPIRKLGFFKNLFEAGEEVSTIANLSTQSAESTILGVESLYLGLKAVTGDKEGSAGDYFSASQIELSKADEDLAIAKAALEDANFTSKMPAILRARIDGLSQKLAIYSDLVKKARATAYLLPSVVGLDGKKDYLILLQNNMELRPAGGFIGSFAKVSFEGGKLKALGVNDIYAIDGQLKVHVEPPKEIITDLGQKDWFLRDSNWEPDFPTSARQAEWFYTKETGERVSGVFALDISAMEDLLFVVGPLELPDYNEKVTADNLFVKAISHAEENFFAGSQAKKTFLTALTNQLFNKIFFLPQQNWTGIVNSLGRSLQSKHISIYLDDPKLFSYVSSQNWASLLPRPAKGESRVFEDFLAPVEANLGANKANYYLDRSYKLETVIGKDGQVSHNLKIAYVNRSPSNTFPAGIYKDRIRLYLPLGSKLVKVLWGEVDMTKDVTNFVDYGRTGMSTLLELAPKEQKSLILNYQVPGNLQFSGGKADYRLDVVKQAGTLKDPFEWKLTFPINYHVASSQAQALGLQEQIIKTDLSQDRSFKVTFSK